MKKCPTCDQMCPDDAIFCRQCGEKFPETEKGSSVGISEGNTSTGGVHMNDVHSDSDGRDDMDAPNSDVINSGDDNVTYVSKTTNKTNSDNVKKVNSDNNIINNYWPKKSKGELLEENLLRYRLKCKEFYKNGLISKDAEEQLHELQVKLCLADELVLPIKKEIQQMSRVPSTELSLGVIAGINNTKSIIELNSSDAIRRHLRQLESWMQVYDDDSLRSWCCQLSSMLDPIQFTERFEQSAKDEYWHRYWAHIAYMLQNKEEQAYEASSCLGLLQANHPEHDEVLLFLVGRLIQNEPIESIENEFNTGALFCSQELQLLCDTVNELLHKKWSQLWDVIPGTFQVRWSGKPEVRPAHSFYANNLFKSFVNTQIEAGKKQREEEERISRGERQRQEEINRQKGYLLKAFEKVEDIDKACADLSIPYLTFKKWQEEDDIFNSKYNAIVRHIEDKRNEEAEKIRIAQELEARVRQQKTQFLSQYKNNDCDFIGTCSELGLGSDVVQTWRGTDKAFDDGLTIIEREHEKKLQELFIQFYESNGCGFQKACAAAGVSAERVNGWRKSNKEFDGVLTAIYNEHVQEIKDAFIKCYHDNECDLLKTCSEIGIDSSVYRDWLNSDRAFADRIKYTEDEINKQHREEDDRLISAQKEQFIAAYELNNCDMQKTCSDLGLSHHDIKKWRESDKVFDNKVSSIKKTHDKKLWKFVLSKVIPVILVIALLAFIVCRIGNIIKTKQQEELKTELVINTHKDLLSSFDIAISKVKLDDNGADALEKVASILFEIKSYEDIHKDDLTEPKYAVLRQRVLNLCDDLFAYYRGKATPLTDNPSLNEQDVIKYGGLRDRVKVLKSKI